MAGRSRRRLAAGPGTIARPSPRPSRKRPLTCCAARPRLRDRPRPPVRSHKTIYVRFDLNDYSIPPASVGRPLSLVASETMVRILDGTREVARHRRSYDRHRHVDDPAHVEALLAEKQRAQGSTPCARLIAAVPAAEALLEAASSAASLSPPPPRSCCSCSTTTEPRSCARPWRRPWPGKPRASARSPSSSAHAAERPSAK